MLMRESADCPSLLIPKCIFGAATFPAEATAAANGNIFDAEDPGADTPGFANGETLDTEDAGVGTPGFANDNFEVDGEAPKIPGAIVLSFGLALA